MTKANALRGWRSPEEKPVEGVTLLVVLQSKTSGITFVSEEHISIEFARDSDDFNLIAWQYCPVWDEEGKD